MVERPRAGSRLDVELKEDGYVEQRAGALAQGPRARRSYVVTSFLDAVLAAVRALAPRARTGLLIGPGPRRAAWSALRRLTGASFLAPHAGLARAGLLAWAANRGLDSYVWTVNDRRALRALLADPRVAAVITDRPTSALADALRASAIELVRALVEQRRGGSSFSTTADGLARLRGLGCAAGD